jgi:murein DD-endopeptidase MepM/ murein hydrolase activator NlpD
VGVLFPGRFPEPDWPTVRFFPSAARHRATAACLATVTVAALVVPWAAADDRDDLRQRQRDVQGQITEATADLKETSRQVFRANAHLQSTLGRLDTARAELRDVRARVVTARERDAQLKVELAEAERRLELATDAVEQGQQDVEDQRGVVRTATISAYTNGDPALRAIGNLLGSGSLDDFDTVRMGEQVLAKQHTNAFRDLEEIEAQLVEERAEVARQTDAVEKKKQEAAAHLETMRGLFAETTAATERVQGLVGQARVARQKAYAARKRDRAILADLRARERKIQDRLVALARSQAGQTGFNGNSDGYLSMPTSGPVTSPYGYRTHPIYGYYGLHNGTDFGTGCSAPLYAVAGGTVLDTYYDSVYGNRLFLSLGKVNGRSLVVIYNHLTSYKVSEGARIARGTVVGLSGSTGWSTGCHLHFTVMENGTPVDPMKYL